MAWTLIDSLDSPTSGAFTFASLTLTSYAVLQIVLTGVTVTTDGTNVVLTFYVSGSEVTTGYRWGLACDNANGTSLSDGNAAAAGILLCSNDLNWDVGNAAGEGLNSIVTVDDPTSTTYFKKAQVESIATGPTGVSIMSYGLGIMENTGAINGLKIAGTSNLTAGKVRLLGWA